ncbi:polyprenyl synthetase family protein [Mycetocola reblochoni]|uniref:Octaprenyl diphosphate synthase / Dimethylallyltransferase / (2E,6E)-farnesyl diphosphate synthase / Geranylgeranyl diphosphate synthase n=2 Tax=Mycetocola reblochoni TaxID=331618 RepID=A0A1R4I7U3_9MICO|nr:polyprenyl synthetase family protein [Mycetocola reblochoni]RLP68915.1 polyprenyl synthetase family protein [Mycetocola reblochoni]SJN15684.1 Octaprenyl diphosphate synthase / Dimethylallyltransferase / (2E,6E)-farnesyl diphosphate synthase / Geranylgeranyl diphosphate synthase [Mycetocola reblochoni REB411]
MPAPQNVAVPQTTGAVASAVDRVRERLDRLARAGAGAALRGTSVDALWREIARTVTDGKLIRPAMLLAVVARSDRGVDDDAIDLAAAIELLHKAFLLHDDVIDHDTVRRGAPNLIGRFSRGEDEASGGHPSVTRGEAAGILAGDLLLASAHDLVARLDVPAPLRNRLLDDLAEALQWSVAGELDDVSFAANGERPDAARVAEMLHAKTGAYTVRLPLQWGFALSGAAPDAGAIERYSRAVGLAFQIQDDLLGLFGDPELVGKDRHSDLREGKVTAVIAHAYGTADWPRIEAALGTALLDPAEGDAIIALLDGGGARASAESDLAGAIDAARAAARELTPFDDVLGGIVDSIEGRRG